MTHEQFLILNIVLVGFFALLFLWGRRTPRQPSNLKVTYSEVPLRNQSKALQKPSQKSLDEVPSHVLQDLNTQFMYNGHSWDAYEVLGVQPGSSVEKIKQAFEQSIKKTDSSSHEFLKCALAAILSELKKRGYRP